MQPIKYYLPDEIFILLSTLGYALCVRILGIKGSECLGVSKVGGNGEGLILWFFLLAMFVVVFVSKYLDCKDIFISFIGGLIAFSLGLGLHSAPLDCVVPGKHSKIEGLNWVRIMQAVFVGIPLCLYCLVLFSRRGS
ncbi:uncharacterized protein LOC134824574 [Bolinopsis microptera]|uniref:uncharacterized protein LOC134824574 n=1 Tax=Bolinopsis microptera TaxID=2820187 RepID=UPI0030795510